jgi:hypothetical protein
MLPINKSKYIFMLIADVSPQATAMSTYCTTHNDASLSEPITYLQAEVDVGFPG